MSPAPVPDKSSVVRPCNARSEAPAESSRPFASHTLSCSSNGRPASGFSPFAVINEPLRSRPPQPLQARKLRDTQVGDANSAIQMAILFTQRTRSRRRIREPQADSPTEVQLLQSRQQGDSFHLRIGHHRRPAHTAISPLDALEAQFLQPGEQLEDVQTCTTDLIAAEIQLFDLWQRRQLFESHVAHLRLPNVPKS